MLLGSVNLGIGLITTTLWILSTFFAYQRINILFIIFSIILLFVLISGSILAFTDTSITKSNNTDLTENISKELESSHDILLHYLPLINFYAWYTFHDFDGKQIILKESMFIWTIFAIVCLFANSRIISIFLILIIMRIILLIIIWDITPVRWTQTIDTLFKKNIEESWWWLFGSLFRGVWKLLGSTTSLWTLQTKYKLSYSYLYDLRKYGDIQWQYLILIIATGYGLYSVSTSTTFGFIILWTILLRSRYIMMAVVWKHLPPIPLIDDIFRNISVLFNYKK